MKVWTNGCFDILHRGHIELFRYAKSLGDELVVGIDTETAEIKEEILYEGDIVRQRVGQPHQLEALTNGIVFEVSTQHFDEDSYRVLPGYTQEDTQ